MKLIKIGRFLLWFTAMLVSYCFVYGLRNGWNIPLVFFLFIVSVPLLILSLNMFKLKR